MILIGAHTFQKHNGYGRWARSIVASLQRNGFNVGLVPGTLIPIPEDLKHLEHKGTPDILVYPPFTTLEAPVQFTTYESTELPKNCVKELRKRKLVVVLSNYNKKMCNDSGLRNVEVCHPAVRPNFQVMQPMTTLNFIHIGADNSVPERKRTKDVIAAFLKAFPRETDVRLVIKKDACDVRVPCFDNRITVIHDTVNSLAPLYLSSHVGVFPSGQEGWGYCQSELMAMGRPVIAPFYGGPADFCDDTNSYRLPFKLVPVPREIYHSVGKCARVSVSYIVDQLRWCYENRDDIVLKGVHAYRRMLGFSIARMDARIQELLRNL